MNLFRRSALGVTLWLAAAAPAEAAWQRAESAHFVVYSHSGEERLRTQVADLEDFHQLLRQLTASSDQPDAAKLSIYMVRGNSELRQVWPAAGESIDGFYTASPEGILAVVDENSGRGWVGRNEVLFHEYSHHFMLQHFPAVYPQWYGEGFAEYMATARIDGDTIEYGRANAARASWLANRQTWIPLEQILFADPARIDGSASQFYAESWLLVHYLLRDRGRARQLAAYLTAVSRGEDPHAAFRAAFGISSTQLQRALSAYAASQISFTRIRRTSASARAPVAVSTLPDVANDLLLLDAATRAGVRLNADGFIRHVRRAAGTSTDSFALRVLARAEALYGDRAAAESLLGALLRQQPRDAELLYLMGMRHLVAGRADAANRAVHFRNAQHWFALAHRADPNHYPTLYRYAESLSAGDELFSENTINILLLAQQIAPQAHAIRLSTANLLMRRGRWSEAEALLTPLASHPHAGAMTRMAAAMLAKARAHDSSGLAPVFEVPTEDAP